MATQRNQRLFGGQMVSRLDALFDRPWSSLIMFDKIWTSKNTQWSNAVKHFVRLDARWSNMFDTGVWYRLATQFNFNIFGHQKVFDRFWSANIFRLDSTWGSL